MKERLVITPHGDDASLLAGGQIALWSKAGDRVTVVRVTNDDFDSVGMTVQQTIEKNAHETKAAYNALGVAEVIDLGYRSDYLHTADYTALRADIIRIIRNVRPYTILAPDRDTLCEDNMDHVIIANACAEALWQSSFALHCPQDGLPPYSVPERLLYSRNPSADYSYVNITDIIETKIAAICLQPTPIQKMFHELAMRAAAMGQPMDAVEEVDFLPTVAACIKKLNAAAGAGGGVPYAERIKNQGYGLLELFI